MRIGLRLLEEEQSTHKNMTVIQLVFIVCYWQLGNPALELLKTQDEDEAQNPASLD